MIQLINKDNDEPYEQEKHSDPVTSNGDISKSTRIRHSSRRSDVFNRIILEYNAYILCIVFPILYIILQAIRS